MPFRQTTVADLPAISLYNDTLELIALPAVGARITHLRRRRRGREWLWHNPVLTFEVPAPEPEQSPSVYVDRYDSGGWDECFPTVGACPNPGPVGQPLLPDHGELWHAWWTHDVYVNAGIATWRSVTQCRSVPAIFSRLVEVPEGENDSVTLSYSVRSTADEPFPWLWSAHPLFTAQPGTLIELPGIESVKVDAGLGSTPLSRDQEVGWPLGGGDRYTMPEREGWAAKLFARSPADGKALLTDALRGETLELRWNGAEVPWVGMWLNPGGFGPENERHYTLAIEPCTAAPDRLDRALNEWQVAPLLQPAEERSWRLTVVLRDEAS